jgi:hypothetical protein
MGPDLCQFEALARSGGWGLSAFRLYWLGDERRGAGGNVLRSPAGRYYELIFLFYAVWEGRKVILFEPMPDIFISYAKADRALARELSTYLDSEGWTV